jgi:predicted GNAT family acetyltransferase
MMRTHTYSHAAAFLNRVGADLEVNEAANCLMLGLCGELMRHPERLREDPCLKTVEDDASLVLAAMMTPPHNLIVYGHGVDIANAAEVLVEHLLSEGWQVPGALGPSAAAKAVARAWTTVTNESHELARQQHVYEIRQVKLPAPEQGWLRLAAGQDAELVSRWRYQFVLGVFGTANRRESDRAASLRVAARDVYLWEDGRPVAMAMKTRPTRHGISVSYVYTPPGSRRRGYATACVAELSRVLLGAGWEFCSLFADVENTIANHIYQRIGYVPVCDYSEYGFQPRE